MKLLEMEFFLKKCAAFLSIAWVVSFSFFNEARANVSIVGKNEWLFYEYEFSDAKDIGPVNDSLQLIERVNRVLSANGVRLVVVMVPLKIRTYSEYLPDEFKLTDYIKDNYDFMLKKLRTAGVSTVDVNSLFLSSPKRVSDSPLYFRLDSHWSPTGSMLAAEAVAAHMALDPGLKKLWDDTPEVKYTVVYGNRKRSIGRDLVGLLPPNSPAFAPEQVAQVAVKRSEPLKVDLLGNRVPVDLALLGSSYSKDWTGFPDALRYVLQRDMLSIGVGADQGSWIGLETYLRDDAFQLKAPKLLFWEMPERDMRAPPSFEFRDLRYKIDDQEWLLRVSAWVQNRCKASVVNAKLELTGLASQTSHVKGGDVITGATTDKDFVELSFDRSLEKLDYLDFRSVTAGSKSVTFEVSGPGVHTRRFTVSVAGDDIAHALKTPLVSNGRGFTKVKIFPGTATAFALQSVQMCRQPEGLLN